MLKNTRPLAVAFLSASTLAYEILLVRAFAIEQFHHFAYMAIGVAMLGFGASGTLLALVRPRRERAEVAFGVAALLTPISLIASASLVSLIPLDATQLPWDPWTWPRLAAIYLLLALPFAAGGMAILLALTVEPERVGWLYGASFVGAGVGAILAVSILGYVFPTRALAVPACLASLGALSSARHSSRGRLFTGLALATVFFAAAVLARPLWRLEITPYKGLPQVEAFPGAQRVAERASPLGWVVAVDAPAFRYAPGLSLLYRGAFPRQTALFVDAETAGAVSSWREDSLALTFLDWLPTAAPYALGEVGDVLVVGAGGGTEVWNGLAHGARTLTAVELNPDIVALATSAPIPRSIGKDHRVRWITGDARGFVARSRERFDLITLATGQGPGTSAAGVYALNEDFLHTVEAYADYLNHLSDDGVLAITRWLTVPPRENVRVILALAEALRRVRGTAIGDGLIVVHSWATGTVLAKPSGFRPDEVDAVMLWARERGFDLDWYPGIEGPGVPFNALDEPVLFRAAAAGLSSSERAKDFASDYPFNVAPSVDAQPYAHHFLRAGSIRRFLERDRGSWLAFGEWGYIALLATLVQSVLLAALLMIVPAAIRVRGVTRRRLLTLAGYFGAIGFAYLAAEIAAIQQLHLLLGHPVYAVAATLAAFLVCSGIGAAWSDRLPAASSWWVSAALAAILVGYAALLLGLVHLLQPAPLIVRALVALVVLAPLAGLMGAPFPVGLRSLTIDDTEGIAWAWAANGFASVVATPLAALIALETGSRTLLLCAGVAYVCAATLQRFGARQPVD